MPVREVRKVVTVLFCDLTGSTALGERTDPEALRALMNRYYESARAVLERHGGTVEKFVGDAVMAVFGIPVATEDDALRAVRAAVELRDLVHGLELEARIGINTGEVVAGVGDTLVTGDAVNVAARLEQAAGAGEVLLGDATMRLVRDAVETEPLSLSVRGKTAPVITHRLLTLDPTAAGRARDLERPMVGRHRERDRLHADYADAAETRTCRLFTLIGPAGVGKSRLVADFLEHVDGSARIARARALSYGEGITYWPLVEILVQLDLDPEQALRASPADTQLATRELLERVAEEKPLVLVLDDLQWAEPPLLDLIEHVADWSRETPIFLLCVARPELLDVRPGWGGGKLNATSVLLEPLGAIESAALVDDLLADLDLDAGVRGRILETAEGNPLFLEELVALAREARGSVDVPPTIQAVLQARLDGLDEHERSVIETGSVEGKVFHRGAVTALARDDLREDVPGRLLSLVRKELVRPDRTQIAGDDAYRFRHLLIRDTAYEALAKATRAELHERFADWLETHGELLELDEILGYHLEQAARYQADLGHSELAAEVATRAAEKLGTAGLAAVERQDMHAVRNLLGRAVALLPPGDPARLALLPSLVEAMLHVREPAAAELVTELERGSAVDATAAAALRLVAGGVSGADADPERSFEERMRLLDTVGEIDWRTLSLYERARGWAAFGRLRMRDAADAFQRSLDLTLAADSRANVGELVRWLLTAMLHGPHSGAEIEAAAERLEGVTGELGLALVADNCRTVRFGRLFFRGELGRDEFEAALRESIRGLRETGFHVSAAIRHSPLSHIYEASGDLAGAERLMREGVELLASVDDRGFRGHALGTLGRILCDQGRPLEARAAVDEGRAISAPDDIADQIQFDVVDAYAAALLGEAARARELVERADQLRARTDSLAPPEEIALARTFAVLGDVDAARERYATAIELTELKGNTIVLPTLRAELTALG